mmetsp:Transcript_33965/g.25052  ORF Transcript_33965/g.25052 Transcript_33965/m.25052 type:complete len:184 (+) Transcript_33965:341-892(+)
MPPMTAESAADFFSTLGKGMEEVPAPGNNNVEEQKTGGSERKQSEAMEENKRMTFVTEQVSRNVNWDEGAEGIIKRNLLHGNLELAAEVALKCGRTTEALLIAEAGGPQLLQKIKEEFFVSSKDSYVKLFLRSIVSQDFKEVVSGQALQFKGSSWKESLAYVLSYVNGSERQELVAELAEELL